MFDSVDASIPVPAKVQTFRIEPNFKSAFNRENLGNGKSRLSRRFIPRFLRFATNFLFIDDFGLWVNPAIKAGSNLEFDFVMASGPHFSTFPVAYKLSQLKKVPLLLDYRDPWIVARIINQNLKQRSLAKKERAYLERASSIFTTSATISENLGNVVDMTPCTLYTAVDKEKREYFQPIDPNGPYLVYFGSLAYQRSLVDVLRTLVRYEEEKNIRVTLYYAGPHEDFALEQAKKSGAKDILVSLGQIERSSALGLLQYALASVIVGSAGYQYALPGKIFEAVSLQKPILLNAEDNSAAYRFVEEFDLGFSCSNQAEIYRSVDELVYSGNRTIEIPTSLGSDAMIEAFEKEVLGSN